jgi:hypothetical protein
MGRAVDGQSAALAGNRGKIQNPDAAFRFSSHLLLAAAKNPGAGLSAAF